MPSSSRVEDDIELINSPVTLPNGVVVPNRLVKAAMEEGIGNGGGLPTRAHRRLYRRWAEGGWGVIITGNVQVDPGHLATPHDRTMPPSFPSTTTAYAQLHDAIRTSVPTNSPQPLTLIQISHAGLQSSSTMNLSRAPWVRAIAPTSARPDTGTSAMGWVMGRALWPVQSREMVDPEEWVGVVRAFVRVAEIAEEAGWGGAQVHSAHGYLLAEYLSPLTNPDPLPLPGVPERIPLRLHLLYLILVGIDAATDPGFVKGVKINCSDFVQGGLDEEQSTTLVKEIISWKLVDVLEISGGNYSSPAFATLDAITNNAPTRQSLFAHFTTTLLPDLPSPPLGPAIILTGGLHGRNLIASSLRTRACDLVGIGRPACVKPALPRDIILNREIEAANTNVGGYVIPGGETMKSLLGGGRSEPIPSKEQNPAVASYLDDETTPLVSDKPSKKKTSAIPLIGAGVSTYWHEWQLCRLGRGLEPDMTMHWAWGGLLLEGVWWGMLGGGPVGWWRNFRTTER